ncbi:hypothetical protein TVAG_404900 [Trichomonas vaginalis G3]|uniref:Uncharacterized protein n=1 Tax=Trichomonas vaginalis (strain ATCC PRA-98 / G3) TaxID=412133 RepID=A2E308_TRIV3|nr:hypothetical protein TVAGG3_0847850 [Trichomonas vaginalis G3]EAY12944.1 hypothetical protein TVAG_404900 [Trichomonas vaginalis G3]KAI5499756.1 hypothetical protein TVAGG3_0847850 [Trichomonas vaginalis G3]|eukprot:XP_001325167.1 hypothetical protein [Trichomonas vaginalis G3]
MFLFFCVATRQTAKLCYDGNTNQCPSDYQTFNENNFANLQSLFDESETEATIHLCKSIPDFMKNPLYIGRNMELTFSKCETLSENPNMSISIGSANSQSTMNFDDIKVNFNVSDSSFEDNYSLFFTNSYIYKNDALNLSRSYCDTDTYSFPSVSQINFKNISLYGPVNKIYFDTNSSMNATYIYHGSEVLVYKPSESQNLSICSDQVITMDGVQDIKIPYTILISGASGFYFGPGLNLSFTLYLNFSYNKVITDFPEYANLSSSTDNSITLEFVNYTNKDNEYLINTTNVYYGSTLNITSTFHLYVANVNLFDSSKINLFKIENNTITQIKTEIKGIVLRNGEYTLKNYIIHEYATSYGQTNITLINTIMYSSIIAALNYVDYTKIISEDKISTPPAYQFYPYNMPEDASQYVGKKYPYFCTKDMSCSQFDILNTRFILISPLMNEFAVGKGLNFTCDVIDGYTCFEYQLTSNRYTSAVIGLKEYKTTSGNIAVLIVMALLSLISIGVIVFYGFKK